MILTAFKNSTRHKNMNHGMPPHNAFVSLPGRLPLLEATDGACNAPVAAPPTIAFSTSTKPGF
jgi:hypothetical protein